MQSKIEKVLELKKTEKTLKASFNEEGELKRLSYKGLRNVSIDELLRGIIDDAIKGHYKSKSVWPEEGDEPRSEIEFDLLWE